MLKYPTLLPQSGYDQWCFSKQKRQGNAITELLLQKKYWPINRNQRITASDHQLIEIKAWINTIIKIHS